MQKESQKMLRINANFSPEGAKKYFCEAYYKEGLQLQHGYYSDHNEAIGMWGGKAAAQLGLTGDISKEDFGRLCDNINPLTGKTLTQRNDKDRIVGYDFTFNATKTVSLACAFGNENEKREILSALHYAVKQTMLEVERDMQTRVRAKGKDENRITGNIAYGEFTHFTTRSVEGMPDPHLHSHCFVFNATYDTQENKWKAAKFRQLKQDASYYEAVFHSKLADRLQSLGYGITQTKNAFDITGVEKSTIDKFSRRTKEIEEYSKEHNITDEKQKSKVGAKTREAKRADITPAQQEADWLSRLTAEELTTLKNLKTGSGEFVPLSPNAAEKAVEFSLKHHLERKSVASDKEILATAIKSSIGKASPEQVIKALNDNDQIIMAHDELRLMVTTKEALQEEKQLIIYGRQNKNIYRPIHEHYQPQNPLLNDQQLAAVKHVLSSTDGVIVVEGQAGTGKTTMMKEVKKGIDDAKKQIFAFAPSSDASRNVLRNEGFENADTVARLLRDKLLQETLKKQVILIDEAGMLSNKAMNGIFAIAQQQSARVILVGDTKQHNSVERGDAMRILIKEAGIKSVKINKILRQKNDKYKEAVKLLADGQTDKGFKQLETIGAVAEIENGKKGSKPLQTNIIILPIRAIRNWPRCWWFHRPMRKVKRLQKRLEKCSKKKTSSGRMTENILF
jgi:conjugative relaxase-like TrwC/TraI family protein